MSRVEAQCKACRGTGLYHGFAEPPGVGVVCLECSGSGKFIIEYEPYSGRRSRTDIHTVQRSRGSFLATGVGPGGRSITYQEFLDGKMP